MLTFESLFRYFQDKSLEKRIIERLSHSKKQYTTESITIRLLVDYYTDYLPTLSHLKNNTQRAQALQQRYKTQGHQKIRQKLSSISKFRKDPQLLSIVKEIPEIKNSSEALKKVLFDLAKAEKKSL